jgi:peroxiredoxin
MKIRVGMQAPDFELESHLDDKVRLSEYRGRHHVVIAFFPLAWTPV